MKPLILPPESAYEPEDDKSLTAREAALIEEIVGHERKGEKISITQAAINAGYAGTREVARISATQALKRTHVIRALRERLSAEFQIGAPSAFQSLLDLAVNANSEHVRSISASSVLDRAGYVRDEEVRRRATFWAAAIAYRVAMLQRFPIRLPAWLKA